METEEAKPEASALAESQTDPETETQGPQESQPAPSSNEDLEDGEIEDDDEEEEVSPTDEAAVAQQTPPNIPQQQQQQQQQQSQQLQTSPSHLSQGNNNSETDYRSSEQNKFTGDGNKFGSPNNRFHGKHRDRWRFERREERRGSSGDDKSGKHLTEAEKSVMYLHKLERMEREKREKYKREHGVLVDDFASNIEKAIANVLKKEQKDKEGNIIKTSDDEKEETKRGKKRKKRDKDKKKSKQRRMESPKGDGSYPSDDNKDFQSGLRGIDNKPLFGSPRDTMGNNNRTPPFESRSPSRSENDEGTESDASLNRMYDDKGSGDNKQQQQRQRDRNYHNSNRKNSQSRGRNKRDRRDHRKHNQDRNKDKKATASEPQPKDSQGVCVFYMQGKCHKGDDCTYSHEALPPMKLELCKFYLMDCCAKGDKCLYMHSEFPCKFYHTGLKCFAEENCKFSHGKPLSGGLKQILFKHIETAPKEILGDFPRLTRDGAINMINQTQKTLESTYGSEGGGGSGGDDDKDAIPSLFDISVAMPGDIQNDGEHKEKKEKTEKSGIRERKSRWQDADPAETAAALQEQQIQMALRIKGFYAERDQDMRVTSNGDVDMRTMPPHLATMPLSLPPMTGPPPPIVAATFPKAADVPGMSFSQDIDIRNTGDVDIRNATSFFDTKDVDIRRPPPNYTPMDVDTRQIDFAKDVDIRHFNNMPVERGVGGDTDDRDLGEESNLEIVTDEDHRHMPKGDVDSRTLNSDASVATSKDVDTRIGFGGTLPPNLPKKQMELFLRIQAQQKDAIPDVQGPEPDDNDDANVDWYSDDDDDCRLTIKDDIEEPKPKVEDKQEISPSPTTSAIPQIKPNEVMEKLGDLSKIDISAEVTKLLSSISQGALSPKESAAKVSAPPKDPRLAPHLSNNTTEPPKMSPVDPRRTRVPSTETKLKETKLSVYEQGSLSIENAKKDVDLRNVGKDMDLRTPLGDLDLRSGMRSDIDLRNLNLPFKAIQNYTPATEVDASINSHPPIPWKVNIVDIPQPDYTGLKLTIQDAHATGDPRLRKIFRLSVDEKESPASPKESPKVTQQVRVDPRRRKMEDNKTDVTPQMTYSQQMNVLQSSAFYQSLTSNQKLLLNQELAAKTDGSGSCNPVLTGLLSNLGLLPNVSVPTSLASIPNSSALNILANLNSVPMGPNPAAILGPNPLLLGQNPNQALMATNVPPPGLIGQNPNFPHIMSQNPNAMGPPHPALLGPVPPPNDFQLNFDPRQGGLLGNAPLDFPPPNYGPGGGDDFYPDGDVGAGGGGGNGEGGGGGGGNGGGFRGGRNRNDGRGYGRDNRSRRGRNFNNRNGNRNFRNRNHNRSNNNSNRSRTPP